MHKARTALRVAWRRAGAALPILQWLPKYRLDWLQADIIAGLTVGLMVVPQGLAYASSIAGLPSQYGLYSAFMGCFVYFFLGSSRDVTLGPTAILSLLMKNAAGRIPGTTITNPVDAIALGFLSGCYQLLFGIFNLGFLVDFISYPVISGFTSSAVITIAVGQLPKIFGVSAPSENVAIQFKQTCENLPHTNPYDFAMGATCCIVVFLLMKLKEYGDRKNLYWCRLVGIARNFLVVLISAVVTYFVTQDNPTAIARISKLPSGVPSFEIPELSVELFKNLAVTTIPLALIGFLESFAVARAFAQVHGYHVNANHELLAIGTANVANSFVQGYALTGSFSRSAVQAQSGVRSPAAGIVTGSVVLLSLAFLTPAFAYISSASLAAITILALGPILNLGIVRELWRFSKLDLIPWAVAFFTCLFSTFIIGIGSACAVNAALLLFFSARPGFLEKMPERWTEMVAVPPRSPEPSTPAAATASSGPTPVILTNTVNIVRLGGRLLYPNATYVKDHIMDQWHKNTSKAIVIDFFASPNSDYSGMMALRDVAKALHKEHVTVFIARPSEAVREMITKSGWCPHVVLHDEFFAAMAAAQAVDLPLPEMLAASSNATAPAENHLGGDRRSSSSSSNPCEADGSAVASDGSKRSVSVNNVTVTVVDV